MAEGRLFSGPYIENGIYVVELAAALFIRR